MPPKFRGAVDRTLETFGAIDILVNSAGVLIPDKVESMDPADLEHRKVALFRLERRGSGMRPSALGTTRSRRLDPGEAEALEVEELNHAKSGVDLGWRS